MTVIQRKLVQQATGLFDSAEKWNAFLELESLRPAITGHWLVMGTKKLREHFTQNPSPGWRWEEWGSATDTRWFIEKCGRGSLSIGYGWLYEYHLFLFDQKKFNPNTIQTRMKEPKYAPLLMQFGQNSKVPFRSGSMASKYPDFSFAPLDDNGILPIDQASWHAAHATEKFVKEAVAIIELVIRNEELTSLLTELNTDAMAE